VGKSWGVGTRTCGISWGDRRSRVTQPAVQGLRIRLAGAEFAERGTGKLEYRAAETGGQGAWSGIICRPGGRQAAGRVRGAIRIAGGGRSWRRARPVWRVSWVISGEEPGTAGVAAGLRC